MRVNVNVPKRCYHPATGLLLEPGEMEVTEKQAEVLRKAGLGSSGPEDSVATESFEGSPESPVKREKKAARAAKDKE